MIFYNRSILNKNEDLTEIKDIDFLKELKTDFESNFQHYGSNTPIISGTIVNKSCLQKKF